MGKKGLIGNVGAGLVAGGGLKLAQSFGIGATEDPIMAIDIDDDGMNGADDAINGADESELD